MLSIAAQCSANRDLPCSEGIQHVTLLPSPDTSTSYSSDILSSMVIHAEKPLSCGIVTGIPNYPRSSFCSRLLPTGNVELTEEQPAVLRNLRSSNVPPAEAVYLMEVMRRGGRWAWVQVLVNNRATFNTDSLPCYDFIISGQLLFREWILYLAGPFCGLQCAHLSPWGFT
jgi:hypothetical protein